MTEAASGVGRTRIIAPLTLGFSYSLTNYSDGPGRGHEWGRGTEVGKERKSDAAAGGRAATFRPPPASASMIG